MYKKKQKSVSWYILQRYGWHIHMAFTLFMVLFLLGSLLTHSPYDASLWYSSSYEASMHNFFGVVGAYVSSVLLFLMGGASFGLIIILSVYAYAVYMTKPLHEEVDRLLAAFFFMCCMSALLSYCAWDIYPQLTPGGLLGYRMAQMLRYWLNTSGIVAVVSIMLASLAILLRFAYRPTYEFSCAVIKWLQRNAWIAACAYAYCKEGVRFTLRMCKRVLNYFYYVLSGTIVHERSEDLFDYQQEDPVVAHLRKASIVPNVSTQTQAPEKTVFTTEGAEQLVKSTAPKQTKSETVTSKPELDHSATHQQSYTLPSISLFIGVANEQDDKQLMQELERRAHLLEEKLERFGVMGKVVAIKRGPVVTVYEYQPAIDSKLSKIVALEDDLALALQALSIRIIAPIPGRSVVGFEVANTKRKNVSFAKVIKSNAYQNFSGTLPLLLGEDTIGNDVVVDLARMPHLLIAGSTGSGKSVALNGMLISLLCKKNPNELKLILIDPKRLEFAPYVDIPHLLFPIITDPKRVAPVLRFVIAQMEERYEQMSRVGARNIFDYHALVKEKTSMPFMVLVIDELADLMMTAGRETEDLITRIAQMARAAGIHMLVATQRPSVDVITGLIKVNFPSRISFRVTSKIDSRTILDTAGADKLLGRGDMLFLDSSSATLARVHGAFVSDAEIAQVVAHVRAQQKPQYVDYLLETIGSQQELLGGDEQLFEDVIAYLQTVDEISISLLQRKFRIGYNRSARIIDMLESQGYILPSQGGKTRKVIR